MDDKNAAEISRSSDQVRAQQALAKSLADVTLEKKLAIGYGCGTPNLDGFGWSGERAIAVESKCTEHLTPKSSVSSSAFVSVAARRRALAAERKQPALARDPYATAFS